MPCASDTADATGEVSLDPAPGQADVNTPSEPAVDEVVAVDLARESTVEETHPDHIDHDVAVAMVALAEAEKSSAPGMPAEHASQEVRAGIQVAH